MKSSKAQSQPRPKTQRTQQDNPAEDEQTSQPTTKNTDFRPGQRLAAEFLGTLLLVLFHAGAAASLRLALQTSQTPKSMPDVLYLALVDGLSLFILILIVGKVSGVLLNPSVTLGLAAVGRFPWQEVVPYLLAQFAGACTGAAAVLLIFGQPGVTVGHVGAVILAPSVGLLQGMLVEALGAFVLLLTISATAEDPRSPSGWAAFAIGMALAVVVLLIEPVTGGAVNPARAFGPDLVNALAGGAVNWLDYAVVYLIGPILGAVAATFLYRSLTNQPDARPAPEDNGNAH